MLMIEWQAGPFGPAVDRRVPRPHPTKGLGRCLDGALGESSRCRAGARGLRELAAEAAAPGLPFELLPPACLQPAQDSPAPRATDVVASRCRPLVQVHVSYQVSVRRLVGRVVGLSSRRVLPLSCSVSGAHDRPRISGGGSVARVAACPSWESPLLRAGAAGQVCWLRRSCTWARFLAPDITRERFPEASRRSGSVKRRFTGAI